MNRRSFSKKLLIGGGLVATANFPLRAFSGPEIVDLCILHTNDVHSRIEAFPMDGSRSQGRGGAAKRAALINKIRLENEHVLLLDAGDIFQGTPYFNFFGGELEFKLMTEMGYDAATLGNHDFDGGVDGFLKQIPHANFEFVSANYDFSSNGLQEVVKPYTIIDKGPLKIGVFGLGIELLGLVPENLHGKTQYLDPITISKDIAGRLKHDEKCDYVVCLSHLGYKYRYGKVSDVDLAKMSRDIDLIIGGHTHTFLDKAETYMNSERKEVLVNQAGWGGMMLGKINVRFEKSKKRRCISCENQLI